MAAGRPRQRHALVGAITPLAHALGMVVTAEGIETAAHLAWAWRAACDQGQGYHFVPPLPAEAMTELLDAGVLAPERPPACLLARTA